MNIGFREFVEQVRSRSDLIEIIGADVELRPSGSTLKGRSPFHPEQNPSFVVWPATQTWYDFSNGGGRGGDVFAYVQERDKVGFKEAVFQLAERAGVRRPYHDDESWKCELATTAERREIERLLTIAASYYHRVLPTKIRNEAFQQHYRFTDETIDQLQLGWADGHLFEHLTVTTGVSQQLALKTGLFVPLPGSRVEDFFRHRLVFPYWRGGRVVYFTARATEYTANEPHEEPKYKKLLTHSERHDYVSTTVQNDFFYNEDAARSAAELLITEGITDCISAMQAGVPSISPGTTRFRNRDVPRLLELTLHVNRVVICNDSEKSGAGDTGAIATAATLWANGREVCIATIPRPEGKDKIDVNELVATRGGEALTLILAQARAYPDFLLERIPPDVRRDELDRRLEPVLAALVGRTAIRTDTVFDAIKAKFGIRRGALASRLKTLSIRGRATAAARLPNLQVPQIRVGDRQLREIFTETRAMLATANEWRIAMATVSAFQAEVAPLFVRGSSVVRLDRTTSGPPILVDLNEVDMFGALVREADWVHVTDAGPVPVFPPKELARDLLRYPPQSLPAVDAVSATPVFGQDGTLLITPGLHRDTRLWLEADPTLAVGAVPEQPTAAQVAAARSLFFDDLFVDFPFVAPSDRAHALAAVLLPFVRRLIDGCTPLHVIEAPAVGAGKSLFCNLVALIATGETCESRTLPDSDEEIRKMLTAELAMARPIILLDNANEKTTLSAPPLASVLTSTSWTDRILGRTQMLTVPNKAMWMLTGNNPKLARDIARRSIRIRIDPKVDRAWTRASFKHDPISSWAKANRNELVRAALVLVRAWLAAGRPRSRERLGSFEHWAAVIGGVLEVVGVEGFLGNLDELYMNADLEGEAWREFIQAWWEEHGSAETHVAVLTELCEKRDLMLQVRGDGNARSQQIRLGRALHGARDRVFGDIQIVVVNQDRKKRTLYALIRVGQEPILSAASVTRSAGAEAHEEVDP